ncbi:MAG: GGDEF domain-containing protein [Clostridiales bacterium]|nr:GGDEF domain-containing protein [Clostridiales bacterium]
MNNLLANTLNKLNNGIVLVDKDFKIQFWNDWIMNKTGLVIVEVLGKPLAQFAPKFEMPQYYRVLESVMETGQSRFLSGALHKTFFGDFIQNIQVDRVIQYHTSYIMIQVTDITNQYQKVQKMKDFINILEMENDEIRLNEAESRKMAMHDALTGLPNRLQFNKRMNGLMELKMPFALLFMDVDNLKTINDTYGHRLGDIVLQEMAYRLKKTVRMEDMVARLSGDEFAVILEGVDNEDEIGRIVQKIILKFKPKFVVGNENISVSSSVGIALYPRDSEDPDILLDLADRALYQIKRSGKADYAFYSEL